MRKIVDDQMKLFHERVEDFGKTRDEKTRSMLPAIKETMSIYEKDLDNTLRLADEMKDVQLTAEIEQLRASALKSQAVAAKLRGEIRAAAERLDNRVDEFAKQAFEEYRSTSSQLMIVAAAGIIIGILAGFAIGQFGIVKPVNLLKAVMEAFAHNDLKADVPGVDRRDELGDMARTVEVFKKNGLEVERLRTEQQEVEKRSAEQRKADMMQLANDFEGAVGEIIETVSSASTELEASAGTLTKTAERAQELTTMVAAASEEASTNVQSVASATEEMASSVNEISRQVQDLARIANEAVEQAQNTNGRVDELSKAASAHRRCRRADQHDRRTDQSAGPERHHRGGAGRRRRPRLRGRGFRGESPGRTDSQGHRRDRSADRRNPGRHPGIPSFAIKEIGETIARMSEISSTIAAAVEEQGAATQEISRNIQQAAEGTTQVSSNITDVQRGAGETGSASTQVFSAAQSLSRDSNRLKLEVGKFLETVRAA